MLAEGRERVPKAQSGVFWWDSLWFLALPVGFLPGSAG